MRYPAETRYAYDAGEYFGLAVMGVGAGGMVYCAQRYVGAAVDWPLVGLVALATFTLPLGMGVGLYALREVVGILRRPAPDAPGTNVEALSSPAPVPTSGVGIDAQQGQGDLEPANAPAPIPGAVLGRPRPLDRTAEMAVLRGRVLVFLQDAIRVNGAHSQFIPRHSRMGYSSPEWGEMVRALGGAAHAEPNKYTTVMGYESLDALRVAVQEGLPLYPDRPTPKAGGAESPAERP